MKASLRYFSGTGNSYRISNTCRELLKKNNYIVDFESITKSQEISENCDIIGFCFPVYAYGIPRICRKYLKALPKFSKQIKTFVLITGGDENESGYSVPEAVNILNSVCKKTYI